MNLSRECFKLFFFDAFDRFSHSWMFDGRDLHALIVGEPRPVLCCPELGLGEDAWWAILFLIPFVMWIAA